MNEFEMLMGQGADDAERQRMLAEQLRRRNVGGQVFSLSTIPQIQKMGSGMISNAYDTATQVGNRSQQALTRTRQAEQDKLAQGWKQKEYAFKTAEEARKQAEYERKMAQTHDLARMEERKQPDGSYKTFAPSYNTGQFEELPELAGEPWSRSGYKGVGASGGGWLKSRPLTDATTNRKIGYSVQENKDGRRRIVSDTQTDENGQPLVITDDRILDEINDVAGNVIRFEGDKAYTENERGTAGKREAENVYDSWDAREAANIGFSNARGAVGKMLEGMRAGANTGAVWENYGATLTDATALFESGASQMGLQELAQQSLAPISDSDLRVAMQVARPQLEGQAMVDWLVHKDKSLELLNQMNTEVLDFMSRYKVNPSRLPPEDEKKKALEDRLRKIKGDFDFNFKFSGTPSEDTDAVLNEQRKRLEELRRRKAQQ